MTSGPVPIRPSVRPYMNGETPAAASSTDSSEPESWRNGDEFTYWWPGLGYAIEAKHLRESSDGIQSELEIVSQVDGTIHWGRLNLVSTTARESLVNKLSKVISDTPWRTMLERVCRDCARAYRAGEPITVLRPAPPSVARFLVNQLLPLNETAVLYGDGGTGKSLVALAVAVAVSTKTALPCGLVPHGSAPVLYLDWESSRAVHAERLGGLLKGLDLTDAPGIYYRRMTRALADDAPGLRAEISRLGIGLLVSDSFGPACGAEPESADSAIRLFNALRSFENVTTLVVAHVSKASADQRNGASRPFGSVYVSNLARSAWELRPSADDEAGGRITLGLFHRKVNDGRRFPPMGLCLDFDDGAGSIVLRSNTLGDSPDLMARAGLSTQIRAALASGKRSVETLAEETGADRNAVRSVLSRMKGSGLVIPFPGPDGKTKEWGLAAPRGVS